MQCQSRSGFQPLSNGAFWQIESFAPIIRSPEQLERIRSNIRGHPAFEEKRQDAASTLAAAEKIKKILNEKEIEIPVFVKFVLQEEREVFLDRSSQ